MPVGLGQGSRPLLAQARSPITLILEAREPGTLKCVINTPPLVPGPRFPCCILVEAMDPLVELSFVPLVLCLPQGSAGQAGRPGNPGHQGLAVSMGRQHRGDPTANCCFSPSERPGALLPTYISMVACMADEVKIYTPGALALVLVPTQPRPHPQLCGLWPG